MPERGDDPFDRRGGDVPAVTREAALAWLGDGPEARRELARRMRSRELLAAAPGVLYRPARRRSRFGGWIQTPTPQDVAKAHAFRRGWRLAPGQSWAENALGLSTQVPGRLLLAADGCTGTSFLYRGRILLEPAPDWVFGFGEAASLLIQGTRRRQRDRGFLWPCATDWDEKGMSTGQVAAGIACRATPAFRAGLLADLPRMPAPYRMLARAVIRRIPEGRAKEMPGG